MLATSTLGFIYEETIMLFSISNHSNFNPSTVTWNNLPNGNTPNWNAYTGYAINPVFDVNDKRQAKINYWTIFGQLSDEAGKVIDADALHDCETLEEALQLVDFCNKQVAIANIMELYSINETISEENARALEDGNARFTIEPIEINGVSRLVVFVNSQAVYAPVADNRMETYTACFEECERYMNSY